jgi:pyruvate/2-oxoglutarate dehydrogenase complex dihydrolipoamide acyltransferase (E2) component
MNDIPAFRAALPLEAAALSRPAEDAPDPPPTRRLPLARYAKLLVALALVGVSIHGLFRQQATLASDRSVVSAPVVRLRAPIGGVLETLAAPAGTVLAPGTTVVRVVDDRAAAEAAGIAAELAALDALDGTLAAPRRDEAALRRAALLGRQAAAPPREAMLAAGGAWQAWRAHATAGQVVARGDPLADFIACDAAELLATLTQREATQAAPGQAVSVLLQGDLAYRPGTVIGWLPDGMAQEGGPLASLPARPREPSRVLRIALDGAAQDCAVGRHGRVVFDARAQPR